MNILTAGCLVLALQPPTLYERELWQSINDYRQEYNYSAYHYSAELAQWARRWACEYPALIEQRIGAGNSVYRYRGAQHAPVDYYPEFVSAENAWMYAPSERAILDGWRSVDGWIDSDSHRSVLLSEQPCAGIAVIFGSYATPAIIPAQTGPIAAVFLTGVCNGKTD